MPWFLGVGKSVDMALLPKDGIPRLEARHGSESREVARESVGSSCILVHLQKN